MFETENILYYEVFICRIYLGNYFHNAVGCVSYTTVVHNNQLKISYVVLELILLCAVGLTWKGFMILIAQWLMTGFEFSSWRRHSARAELRVQCLTSSRHQLSLPYMTSTQRPPHYHSNYCLFNISSSFIFITL